jgi:O-antigen/teichoic acid export membrane protein
MNGLVANSGALAISRGLAALLRAGAVVVAARGLPVGDFGHLALAFALVEVLRQLSDFGLETVATREIARAGDDAAGAVVGAAAGVKLGLAAAAYVALLALVRFGYAERGGLAVAAVAGVMLFGWSLFTAVGTYFQARLRMIEVAWATTAGGLVTAAGVLVVAAAGGARPTRFAVAFALGDVTAGLLAAAFVARRTAVRVAWRRETAAALVRTAWPVALTRALVILYFRLDVLMLGWLGRADEVGLYGVAFKITEPMLLLPAAAAAAFYAAASRTWEQGGEAAGRRLYRTVAAAAAAYGVAVALAITAAAAGLLAWLVPAYAAAAPALRVLAWSVPFMALNMVTTAALNAAGRFRTTTMIAGTTLAVCAVANLVLIRRYGIVGAGAATVVTEATNTVLQLAAMPAILRGGGEANAIMPRTRAAPTADTRRE